MRREASVVRRRRQGFLLGGLARGERDDSQSLIVGVRALSTNATSPQAFVSEPAEPSRGWQIFCLRSSYV